MENNFADIVLCSFDEFMQNRYVYYQLNWVLEEKNSIRVGGILFIITCFIEVWDQYKYCKIIFPFIKMI
jgi:hypothetical protein